MDLACMEVMEARTASYDRNIFCDPRVLTNLLALEDKYLPRPGTCPDPKLRKSVVGWMLEFCEELGCEEQVFPLAVNFLDRFVAACPIKPNQLSLSATVSLLVSSKVRMSTPFSVKLLCILTGQDFTSSLIKDWELLFLSKLQWEICGITGFDYLDFLLKIVNVPESSKMLREHALTLLGLAYTDFDLACIKASVLASAAIVSAARGLRLKPDILNYICLLIKSDPSFVESVVLRVDAALSDCAMNLGCQPDSLGL